MSQSKSVAKNGLLTALSGGGFGLTAVAGACGGACASAFPLASFLASIGLGALAPHLNQVRVGLLVISAALGATVVYRLVKRRQVLGGAIVAVALIAALGWSGSRAYEMRTIPSIPLSSFDQKVLSPPPGSLVPEASIEALRERFNSASDRVRLVSILSPVCRGCVRGYRVIDDLLKQYPSDSLRAEIVWIPMVEGDAHAAAADHAALQTDPRITNSWDRARSVGDAFRDTLALTRTAWDVYMLYEPGVRWDGRTPPKPTIWMHQLHPVNGADPKLHLDPEILSEKLGELLKQVKIETGGAKGGEACEDTKKT